MNYKLIYEKLIERARLRQKDSSLYHNHHIIPRHADKNSKETVPLTIREHSFAHRLLWKINGSPKDFCAYMLLSKASNDICSAAGKIGGKTTKNNGSGIFSENWNRSEFTKSLWETEILSSENFLKNGNMKNGGLKTKENGSGIFSENYDRSAASKNYWNNLPEDQYEIRKKKNAELAKIGGQKSKELGKNFTTWEHEKRKSACSLGGKVSGKIPMWTNGIVNKKSHDCPGAGWFRGITKKKKNSNEVVVYVFKEKL